MIAGHYRGSIERSRVVWRLAAMSLPLSRPTQLLSRASSSGRSVAVRPCAADPPGTRAARVPPPQPQYYPAAEEEEAVLQSAFHKAFSEAKPERIPGLQEFAAAIWQRRRLIPSPRNNDPLLHIFDEFDGNNDGFLAAPEMAAALRSRGVTITDDQVQWLINTYAKERTCALPHFAHTIARDEFNQFIYSLTISDLHIQEDPTRVKLPSIDDGDSSS